MKPATRPVASLVASALALGLSAAAWMSCGASSEGTPQGTESSPDGGSAAVTVIPYRLGFTGAASLPGNDPAKAQQLLAALGYSSGDQFHAAVDAHMRALSAPMMRVHFMYTGGGKFVCTDEGLTRKMKAGADLYGCVNPIPPLESLDDSFDSALAALVAAHPEISHWQLGNEPDLLWKDHTKFAPFFARAQPLVRKACPSCKILLAGISNQYDTGSDSYQRYDAMLASIAAAPLTGRAFDVFDFHYYKEAPAREEIAGAVRSYRALLDKHDLGAGVSFWCTETGLYTGDPDGPQMGPRTEEDQARDLPRLVAWMSAAGVERIYNWTLIEDAGGMGAAGFFSGMGLIYNGLGAEAAGGPPAGAQKKAYATFGLLAAALRDTGAATRLGDGVYRFEGRAGKAAFIVWDEGGASSVSLAGLTTQQLRVRELVPDAEGNTPEQTVTVKEGTATVPVGSSPKLVVGI